MFEKICIWFLRQLVLLTTCSVFVSASQDPLLGWTSATQSVLSLAESPSGWGLNHPYTEKSFHENDNSVHDFA
jgi:hypothetical protein